MEKTGTKEDTYTTEEADKLVNTKEEADTEKEVDELANAQEGGCQEGG